eukprot:271486_1
MNMGDAVKLYNALQNPYYSLFVDVRESDEYAKNRIKNTMNIPLERMKSDLNKDKIGELFKEYKHKHNKHLIVSMLIWTEDLEHESFSPCLSLIREAVVDHEICRLTKLCLITDKYSVFADRFPFLLTNNAKEKAEKLQKEEAQKQIHADDTFDLLYYNEEDHGYPCLILDDGLYLGDFHHATTKQVFMDLHLTHVVNCSRPHAIPCAFADDSDLNVSYIRVPVDDMYDEDIKQYFDCVTKFIADALIGTDEDDMEEEKENEKEEAVKLENSVLIHCQAGISRSSSITIAYLMKYKRMRYGEAYKYVRERRPIIEPNATFAKQLKEYEKTLFDVDT